MIVWRGWVGDTPPWEPWLTRVVERAAPGATFRSPWDLDVPPRVADAIDAVPEPRRARHASNLLRYFALDLYGGIWLDWDVVPLRPLAGLLPGPCCASAGSRAEGGIIAAPPGHLGETLDLAVERSMRWRRGFSVPSISGASVLEQRFRGRRRALYTHNLSGAEAVNSERFAVHLWASSRATTGAESSLSLPGLPGGLPSVL